VVWLLLSGRIFPQPDIKTFTHKEEKIKSKKEVVAPQPAAEQVAVDMMQEAGTVGNDETK